MKTMLTSDKLMVLSGAENLNKNPTDSIKITGVEVQDVKSVDSGISFEDKSQIFFFYKGKT
jgi:hypothetical protein